MAHWVQVPLSVDRQRRCPPPPPAEGQVECTGDDETSLKRQRVEKRVQRAPAVSISRLPGPAPDSLWTGSTSAGSGGTPPPAKPSASASKTGCAATATALVSAKGTEKSRECGTDHRSLRHAASTVLTSARSSGGGSTSEWPRTGLGKGPRIEPGPECMGLELVRAHKATLRPGKNFFNPSRLLGGGGRGREGGWVPSPGPPVFLEFWRRWCTTGDSKRFSKLWEGRRHEEAQQKGQKRPGHSRTCGYAQPRGEKWPEGAEENLAPSLKRGWGVTGLGTPPPLALNGQVGSGFGPRQKHQRGDEVRLPTSSGMGWPPVGWGAGTPTSALGPWALEHGSPTHYISLFLGRHVRPSDSHVLLRAMIVQALRLVGYLPKASHMDLWIRLHDTQHQS